MSRGRLDSRYYLAPGIAARDLIIEAADRGDITIQPLGGSGGLAECWMPTRLKQVHGASGEDSVPYLRPYDVFEYLPKPAGWLSARRTERIDDYRVPPNSLLQTRSGRNLGPLAVSDSYLARYALSDDMIRIQIDDEPERAYVYAFLSSSAGQSILRQRMSGSVVDHLTVDDVQQMSVPILGETCVREISAKSAQGLRLMEEARLELDAAMADIRRRFPSVDSRGTKCEGWVASSRSLAGGNRLDAHYHDPAVSAAREQMQEAGGGPVGDVATAFLPARYKRYYVGPEYGRPILSGRQLLQMEPVNLRYISDRSFKNPDVMALLEGMVAFGAVGRWEGRLGEPALITAGRHGWLASNDVMRLTPHKDIDPGWLWLAMACEPVQRQVAALPYGSVIDHTGPDDIEHQVWLPPVDAELGARARRAWDAFDEAYELRSQAAEMIESLLGPVDSASVESV